MTEEQIPAEPANEAVAVPHQEFKTGLPLGRFRVIVNPQKAHRYVTHRLFVNGISMPLIGLGIAIALWGYPWPGICLGALGILLRRFVKTQAPKILLHLVQRDPKIYYETLEYEIMEVRYSRD